MNIISTARLKGLPDGYKVVRFENPISQYEAEDLMGWTCIISDNTIIPVPSSDLVVIETTESVSPSIMMRDMMGIEYKATQAHTAPSADPAPTLPEQPTEAIVTPTLADTIDPFYQPLHYRYFNIQDKEVIDIAVKYGKRFAIECGNCWIEIDKPEGDPSIKQYRYPGILYFDLPHWLDDAEDVWKAKFSHLEEVDQTIIKAGKEPLKVCGTVEFWRNHAGELHREDGPALISNRSGYTEFKIEYYKNGKLHREDGPATIRDTERTWWLDGKRMSTVTAINKRKVMVDGKRLSLSTDTYWEYFSDLNTDNIPCTPMSLPEFLVERYSIKRKKI